MTNLEKQISNIAGTTVEITIIDEKRFTLSIDEDNDTAIQNIINFFRFDPSIKTIEHMGFDDECQMDAVYLTLK